MARENLANIVTDLTDGNLEVLRRVDLGDRILLIGTSEKGPVDQPVFVAQPQDAIDVFGAADQGTLVQGYVETFYTPGGDKDIQLVRISNGSKAALDLVEETSGLGADLPSTSGGVAISALRIEALNPGSTYNSVSFRQEISSGQLSVIGYNPDTGTETIIPVDPTRTASGSVYDVKTLADAINVDPNLGNVVSATANRINTTFEIDVHEDWDYVSESGGTVTLNLETALEMFDDDADGSVAIPINSGNGAVDYTDLKLRANVTGVAATFDIYSADGSVGTIATDWPTEGYLKLYKENVDGEQSEVEIIKYNGVGPVYAAPDAVITVDTRAFAGTTAQAHLAADTIVAYYIPIFPLPISVTAGDGLDELIEAYELDNIEVELDAAGYAELDLPYPIQMTSTLSREILNVDGTEDLEANGEAIHLVRNGYVGTADGTVVAFSFTAYEAIDPTTLLVYRTTTSGTTALIAAADYTLTDAGGPLGATANVAIITMDTAPQDGGIMTTSYDSVKFDLTQLATLNAVQASTSYKEYFAAGDVITFGTAQPADIQFTYPAKVLYTVGNEAVISGTEDNEIVITASGRDIDVETYGTIVGLDYYYSPEWIALSSAESLQGGTDGITMSNAEKYTVLATTYATIADIVVDVMVPLKTYIDDTKIEYDRETGLPVEVNAGFALQLNTHLEDLLDGVNETFGVMAVKPADSALLADVNIWYDKLVNVSVSDTTRAANIMASMNMRLLDITAMEIAYIDPLTGVPYITTGEAMLAGLTAKLSPESATTNKFLGAQVLGLRYGLSTRQLDALTGARYVTARIRPGIGVVVTDGVTAATAGSDWTRRSTFRIIAAAMDVVRSVGEPFLGEGFNPAKRAALETGITKGLLSLQETGAVQTFAFDIQQTPAEAAAGRARVNLVVQPAFELRRIAVTVRLSATAV